MTIQVSTLPDLADSGRQTKIDRAAYLAELLHLRSELAPQMGWLQEIRNWATARVEELAIPSTKDEEWRFTDLTELLQVRFQQQNFQISSISQSAIADLMLPETKTSRLVFVNGLYAPHLSCTTGLPEGVWVGNLAAGSESLSEKISAYLGKQQGSEEVFTALNTASFSDAAVVWIPPNKTVEVPIHLLLISAMGANSPVIATAQNPALTHPRCLVVVESGSKLTLVEEYSALGEGVYLNNPVTEVWLADNAQLNHSRLQRDSLTAFHIGKTAVSQKRDSSYTCNAVSFGGKLSRHHLEVYQAGEQTETVLNGLTMIGGEQTADTHSTICFTHSHGSSQQIHKCVVDDHAHGVFNGRILVPQAAQLTNAAQLSKNLLLSPKARMDTKPQLEITADNVKCSHGATVSQLEGDEVFYLQSRGIDQMTARKLLLYAFAYEVIGRIPVRSLRAPCLLLSMPTHQDES
jgi:Fe-S cluster assembly protein SufD